MGRPKLGTGLEMILAHECSRQGKDPRHSSKNPLQRWIVQEENRTSSPTPQGLCLRTTAALELRPMSVRAVSMCTDWAILPFCLTQGVHQSIPKAPSDN